MVGPILIENLDSTVAIYTSDHGFGHAVRACFLAEALIARLDEVGLDFAMVYEDFTAEYAADTALVPAQAGLRYARDHYVARERYVRVGGAPL